MSKLFKLQVFASVMMLVPLVLLVPAESRAGEITVELGFDVTTGDYGSKATSTQVSVPLSISYYATDQIDLGLSLPIYTFQDNGRVAGGRVVTIRGRQIKIPSRSVNQSDQGVGDLDLTLGYLLFKETDTLPKVHLSVGAKLPTAEKPIGTGEFDETFGLELSKWLRNWNLFADGSYTIQGRTPLFKTINFFNYDAGIGYELIRDLVPSIGFKGTTPIEDKGGYVSQIEGKVKYAVTRAIDAKVYVDSGLTKASPDWQFGSSLSYSF